MCTCLLGGKKASVNGSVLFAANDDWSGVPGVLTHVPAKIHHPGDTFQLTGGKKLPQPVQTNGYVYTACKYETGALDRAWAGGVNDKKVAIAGVGVNAYKIIPCDGAWLEPDDVQLLILERALSARDGIRMMGDLIKKYGFQPSTMEGSPSVGCYAVADPEEAWWLEIAPGNHWIAVRVPDEEVSVRANSFGIHDADLCDVENVMASEGLADFAREQGWWDGDNHHFDFANVYGHTVSLNEWGPELADMNMRRRWRAVSLFAGKEMSEEDTIYSVVPARKQSVHDFFTVLRDVYEGTKYDLTKGQDAGRYGNPFHDDPKDYSLSHEGTVASIACGLNVDCQPVLWTCMATPRTSFYIPVYADIEYLPDVCESVEPECLEQPSWYWEFKRLGILVCRRFSVNDSVLKETQTEVEGNFAVLLQKQEQLLADIPDKIEKRKQMTIFTAQQIDQGIGQCRKLRKKILLQY